MRVAGDVAGKLRGHHRAGRGHGRMTERTLFARPNYCTGQPSAETPLHNRIRRGNRNRTHGGTVFRRSSRFGQDTHVRTDGLLRHQYTDESTWSRRSSWAYKSVLGNNYLHTQTRTTRALLFPLGLACLHTRRRRARTILQHCFLRRSITQRKFPTKLRKHFFFPRPCTRGRHDGFLHPGGNDDLLDSCFPKFPQKRLSKFQKLHTWQDTSGCRNLSSNP